MLPGDEFFFTGICRYGIAEIHIIRLAAAFGRPQDTTHLAVPDHRLYGSCIGSADAGHPAIFCLEDKMHGVLMVETALSTVCAKHAVAHDLGDIGKIPANEIDRMAETAIEPFELRFQRPSLFKKPPMIGVIVGFDGDQFADK